MGRVQKFIIILFIISIVFGGDIVSFPTTQVYLFGIENKQLESSILRTIRQHTPGLRHQYNKTFPKEKRPELFFVGEITIDSNGNVLNSKILSATKSFEMISNNLNLKIMKWKFTQIEKDNLKFNYSIFISDESTIVNNLE